MDFAALATNFLGDVSQLAINFRYRYKFRTYVRRGRRACYGIRAHTIHYVIWAPISFSDGRREPIFTYPILLTKNHRFSEYRKGISFTYNFRKHIIWVDTWIFSFHSLQCRVFLSLHPTRTFRFSLAIGFGFLSIMVPPPSENKKTLLQDQELLHWRLVQPRILF